MSYPLPQTDPSPTAGRRSLPTAPESPRIDTVGVPLSGMTDERFRALRDHLAATAELPLDREATRWVAEAEAVAEDCLDVGSEAVRRRRIGHVRDLLSRVDSTGHSEGDDHVEAARALAADLADEGGEV